MQERSSSGEEDRAFWTWAAVETLRLTGIRIEELTELSHHSLVQYTLPTSRELIPLLQIVPSKAVCRHWPLGGGYIGPCTTGFAVGPERGQQDAAAQ